MPPGLIVVADASGNIIPARADDPEGLQRSLGFIIDSRRALGGGIGRASSMIIDGQELGPGEIHVTPFIEWDHEKGFPDMKGGLRGPFKFGLIYDAFVWRLYNAKGKEEANPHEFRTLLITTIGKVLEFRDLSITAQRRSFSDEQIRRQVDGRKAPKYMVFGRRNGKLIVNYEPITFWQERELVHLLVGREELEDFMTMITLLATGEFVKYEITAKRKGDEKERLIRATCNKDALEEDEVE
jgi:hypothetical protein